MDNPIHRSGILRTIAWFAAAILIIMLLSAVRDHLKNVTCIQEVRYRYSRQFHPWQMTCLPGNRSTGRKLVID